MDASLWVPLLTIFFLIILSGIFSGSETALTAISRAKLHQMKLRGVRGADRVTRLREHKDRLIGALLLGNNAVNILASALATGVAIEAFGDDGIFIATVVMTTLVLIFAEVLPKTYAIYHAESMALFVSPFIRLLVMVLSPITGLVQRMVTMILKLFGGVHKPKQTISAKDELRGAIELHHHEGTVVKYDRDMLGSILDLAETEVSDVMVHRKNLVAVNADQSMSKIVSEILDGNHTRIPLWRDEPDNIIGVVHVKKLLEILRHHKGDIEEITLDMIMSEPWFVPETNMLDRQLVLFRKRRMHFALVVDEYGDLVGVITLEDILEEIVGQIDDEHDDFLNDIVKVKGGWVSLSGEMTIRDFNRAMDWQLPDYDATTVAGLIIHHAEKIPEVGEEFFIDGYHFKIHTKKMNQITSIMAKKVKKNPLLTSKKKH